MQRKALLALALSLALGGVSGALAQGGDLGGVTMRVLDDVSDIDAVVLDIKAARGAADGADDEGRGTEGDSDAAADRDGEDAGDRSDRHNIEDAEDEERGEGALEDNDVEQTPVEAPEDTVVQ